MKKTNIAILVTIIAIFCAVIVGGAELKTIHEWGVITVTLDDELANSILRDELESMPEHFYRVDFDPFANMGAIGGPLFFRIPMLDLAGKPVIYAYGDGEGSVDFILDIVFMQGAPLIFYPNAEIKKFSLVSYVQLFPDMLSWRGKILLGDTSDSVKMLGNDNEIVKSMRVDDAAVFNVKGKDGEEEYESFLYYDGVFRTFREADLFSSSAESVELRSTTYKDKKSWYVIDRTADDLDEEYIKIAHIAEIKAGEIKSADFVQIKVVDFREKIKQEFIAYGLYEAEAEAMLTVWHDGFFKNNGMYILNILDTADYTDRLKMYVLPEPSELVRVGVVLYLL